VVIITNSTFTNNNAYVGGVIDSYGLVTITGSTLAGNKSVGNGAALENRIGAQMTVANSTLTQNASQGSGGAFRTLGTLTVMNCTITGNTAANNGGGISQNANYGAAALTNTIVAGNTATMGPDIYAPAGRPVTANNCLIGNTAGATITGSNNLTGVN